MWDARDDVILTEAERRVLAELEAAATRRTRPSDVWGRFRARPYALLVVAVLMVTLSLVFTTAVFAASLWAGVAGAVLLLVSLGALCDSVALVAADRSRRGAAGQARPAPPPPPAPGGAA